MKFNEKIKELEESAYQNYLDNPGPLYGNDVPALMKDTNTPKALRDLLIKLYNIEVDATNLRNRLDKKEAE
ncbi:MAG TPA: hypothetical protein PLA71_00840 [Saccharofermentans sp.]|nr:hypothetical protein [Saccharofermentans sp.]